MFVDIKKLPIFAAENSSWILDESLKSNFLCLYAQLLSCKHPINNDLPGAFHKIRHNDNICFKKHVACQIAATLTNNSVEVHDSDNTKLLV